jgi:3-hydroxyacyl-CoA dehydrogenase
MTDSVSSRIDEGVAIVAVDNPPVNALSHHVRVGLQQAFETLEADPDIAAVVLACAGRTFIAGADIKELGAKPIPPVMAEVMKQMDDSRLVFVAAIHGQALGGGLETALLCDYRVATPDARLGLPEINLGLIPGGGGTQRLPRLIGADAALDMILSGKPIGASQGLANGLVDEIVEGDLVEGAVAFARDVANKGRRRVRDRAIENREIDFASRHAEVTKKTGLTAVGHAVHAVEAACTQDFDSGLAREAELFYELRGSDESAALRYLFAAERQVARIPGLGEPQPVSRVAVIGAGTMGGGVTIALLDAGYPVTLVETTQEALERGRTRIESTYASLVKRGRIDAAAKDARLAALAPTLQLDAVAQADLVIECVFEDMAIKKELFAKLGPLLGTDAVLATNTSALDVNEIAEASGRASDVVGMHFFSPANIMRLVEIVDAEETAPDTLATAFAVTKRMKKIGVRAGVCDGFIGNRMIGRYLRQANLLLLEGALPEQIDAALRGFGMAMGPHTMGDMAGLDIQAAARKRRRAEGVLAPDDHFGAVGDRLVAEGRLGLKSGSGIYRYEEGSRTPLPDPEVATLIAEEAEKLGIARRSFDDEEIVARCILPLINEGARIIEEGIALGAADIDVVYCNGYGFPRRRGGPMFHADTLGTAEVLAQIERFQATLDPKDWEPAPLLRSLAEQGGRFTDLPRER